MTATPSLLRLYEQLVPVADIVAAAKREGGDVPGALASLVARSLGAPLWYRASVAKQAILASEAAGDAPPEACLEVVVEAMQSPVTHNDFCRVTFDGIEMNVLDPKSDAVRGDASIGLRLWPAALALVSFFKANWVAEFSNCHCVVEIGAGVGFVGLWCAQQPGVHRVVLTDYNSQVLSNLEVNASPFPNVSVQRFDWHEPDSTVLANAHLMILADCVYDPADCNALASLVARACESGTTKVIMASALRNAATFDRFTACLKTRLDATRISRVSRQAGESCFPSRFVHMMETVDEAQVCLYVMR